MPRQPIDYSKALIYKLCCKDTSIKETYIGSTTDFRHRKSGHKTACNNPTNKDHNNPKYKFVREHGGWENWDMVLVAYAPCETKLELLKIEREYIEKQEKSLNNDIPTRTRSEYYNDNRERKSEKAAEYRATHKEEAAEYHAEYREANREKLAAYIAGYQAANREKLTEYHRAYRARKKAEKAAANETN